MNITNMFWSSLTHTYDSYYEPICFRTYFEVNYKSLRDRNTFMCSYLSHEYKNIVVYYRIAYILQKRKMPSTTKFYGTLKPFTYENTMAIVKISVRKLHLELWLVWTSTIHCNFNWENLILNELGVFCSFFKRSFNRRYLWATHAANYNGLEFLPQTK